MKDKDTKLLEEKYKQINEFFGFGRKKIDRTEGVKISMNYYHYWSSYDTNSNWINWAEASLQGQDTEDQRVAAVESADNAENTLMGRHTSGRPRSGGTWSAIQSATMAGDAAREEYDINNIKELAAEIG